MARQAFCNNRFETLRWRKRYDRVEYDRLGSARVLGLVDRAGWDG